MKKFSTKKIAGLGVLTALALITFIIESLFPPLFIPGAKMGLSNVFTLLALYFYGGGYALITVLAKCILGSLFTGNFSTLMYSLPAGIISLTFEFILVKFAFEKVSVIAVSVGGAVIHNAVQNAVFSLVTNATEVFSLLPYLTLVGVIAGLAVGFAVYIILKTLPKGVLDKITIN